MVVTVELARISDRDRRHGRRDLTRVRRDVKFGNGTGAAAPVTDVLPVAIAADAEGRDNADARDHDSRDTVRRHEGHYNTGPCPPLPVFQGRQSGPSPGVARPPSSPPCCFSCSATTAHSRRTSTVRSTG